MRARWSAIRFVSSAWRCSARWSWPELLRGSRCALGLAQNRSKNGQFSVDPGRHVEPQNMRDEWIDVDILKLFDREPGLQIGAGGVKNPAHLGHLRNVVAMHATGLALSGFCSQVQNHGRHRESHQVAD